MFSKDSARQADACRFCWMCRHLCPVGLKTGREVNTPRAKGLLVSLDQRGHAMDADTAQAMYECTLCGSCTNDCATGFEPPIFIREARTQAIVEGIAPAPVEKVIENIQTTGNMFGMNAEDRIPLDAMPKTAEVLLYLGQTAAYRRQDMARAAISLMRKAGVSFTVMQNEPDTGCALGDLMGYVEDVRAQAQSCADAIHATGAKLVVLLDSYDAAFIKHNFAAWGIALNAETTTATAYFANLVREGRLHPEQLSMTATYHDATPLARDLDEHQPARDLIAAMGISLKEMFLNRRMAKCCGSEVFLQYAPELAHMTAEGRWDDVRRTGMTTLIAADPQALDVLSQAIPEDMRLCDLFTLLDSACR